MTYTQFISFIQDNKVGDIASIIGLLVAVIGFLITIYNVRKSRSAAQEASDRARGIGKTVFVIDKLSEIERYLNLAEDIKEMNLQGQAPLRLYINIRQSLYDFRASMHDMNNDHKAAIQSFITTLTKCENKISSDRSKGTDTDFVKINKQISENIDSMRIVTSELRSNIGREK